jgi:hypothetical protein
VDWAWASWLVVIAASFALFEGVALATRRMTLSRWVWNIAHDWPPFGWLVGLLTGFLAAHFFWPGQGCVITGF